MHAHGRPPPAAVAFSLALARPFSLAPPPPSAHPPAPYQHAMPHAPPPNAASLSSVTASAVPHAACRGPAADAPRRTARPHSHASISCDPRSPSSSIRHSGRLSQVTGRRVPGPPAPRHTAAAREPAPTDPDRPHAHARKSARRGTLREQKLSRIRSTCVGGHVCVASRRRPRWPTPMHGRAGWRGTLPSKKCPGPVDVRGGHRRVGSQACTRAAGRLVPPWRTRPPPARAPVPLLRSQGHPSWARALHDLADTRPGPPPRRHGGCSGDAHRHHRGPPSCRLEPRLRPHHERGLA